MGAHGGGTIIDDSPPDQKSRYNLFGSNYKEEFNHSSYNASHQ
jgi:hypothetical protein